MPLSVSAGTPKPHQPTLYQVLTVLASRSSSYDVLQTKRFVNSSILVDCRQHSSLCARSEIKESVMKD